MGSVACQVVDVHAVAIGKAAHLGLNAGFDAHVIIG
jgi:hypothetical protein